MIVQGVAIYTLINERLMETDNHSLQRKQQPCTSFVLSICIVLQNNAFLQATVLNHVHTVQITHNLNGPRVE